MRLRGTSRTVACPRCGAAAGESCTGTQRNGHIERVHQAERAQHLAERKATEKRERSIQTQAKRIVATIARTALESTHNAVVVPEMTPAMRRHVLAVVKVLAR